MGDGGACGDEGDVRADDAPDGFFEEGVMSAAEDEVVDAGGEHGFEVLAEKLFGGGGIGFAAFDAFDEAGALGHEHLDVVGEAGFSFLKKPSLEGAGGGEYADASGVGVECGGFDAWLNADEGDRKALAEGVDGEAGGGIAGYDDELAILFEEEAGDAVAAGDDFLAGAGAVGAAGEVSEVEGGFVREDFSYFLPDAEAADAGVEESDGMSGGREGEGHGKWAHAAPMICRRR